MATPLVALGEVPVGGGLILVDHDVVVTRPAEDAGAAFGTRCPHQGCRVKAVAAGTINCFCHGSRFRIGDGAVVGGPSQAPLVPVAVRVVDGVVLLAEEGAVGDVAG